MKFGYALLCHKNPDQINSLIDNLNNDQDCFFIHLDAKAFPKDEIRHGSNIFFSKKRFVVHWGHFSQIQALLELLKTAIESGAQFDYLWILSGQDFPIRPRSEMVSYMENNKDYQFAQIDYVENNYNLKLNFYYPDILFSNIEFFLSGKSIGNLLLRMYLKISKMLGVKREKINLKVYKGSLWITLSRQCIEYIINYINDHPKYLNRFRYTLCGDEFFFNSILMNSPYKDFIKEENLRYIDWHVSNIRPKTLTVDDLEAIRQSERFFARKFDLDVDSEVMSHFFGKFNSN